MTKEEGRRKMLAAQTDGLKADIKRYRTLAVLAEILGEEDIASVGHEMEAAAQKALATTEAMRADDTASQN